MTTVRVKFEDFCVVGAIGFLAGAMMRFPCLSELLIIYDELLALNVLHDF
jgi:hypothetical protein